MSSSRKKKSLHVASSIGELNTHAEDIKLKIVINNQIECKRYCDAIYNMFRKAEAQLTDGDEENAYILYMRYLHIFGIIRKSYEYNKRSKHYLEILKDTPTKAIKAAETLALSLEKRYSEVIKNVSLPEPAPAKKPIDKSGQSEQGSKGGKSDSKKTEVSGSDHKKQNGAHMSDDNIDALLPSIPDEGETKPKPISPSPAPAKNPILSVMDLYHVLNAADQTKLLIFDVRPASEYGQSRIKTDLCVNIPSDLLKPGATVNSIERRLPKVVWELWIKRGEKEQIIILDSDTKAADMTINNPARILKDAIFLWGSGVTLKNEPIIVDGGFQSWLVHFPSLTTNAFYTPNRLPEAVSSNVSLSKFSYPELPAYEEPQVNDQQNIPTTPQTANNATVIPNSDIADFSEEVSQPTPSSSALDSQLSRSHISNKLEEMRKMLEERDRARASTRKEDDMDQPLDRGLTDNGGRGLEHEASSKFDRGQKPNSESEDKPDRHRAGNMQDGVNGSLHNGLGHIRNNTDVPGNSMVLSDIPKYPSELSDFKTRPPTEGQGKGQTFNGQWADRNSIVSGYAGVTVPVSESKGMPSSYPSEVIAKGGPVFKGQDQQSVGSTAHLVSPGTSSRDKNGPLVSTQHKTTVGHPPTPTVAWADSNAAPGRSSIPPSQAIVSQQDGGKELVANQPISIQPGAQHNQFASPYSSGPQGSVMGSLAYPTATAGSGQLPRQVGSGQLPAQVGSESLPPQGSLSGTHPKIQTDQSHTPIPAPRRSPNPQQQRPVPAPRIGPHSSANSSVPPMASASNSIPNQPTGMISSPQAMPPTPYIAAQPNANMVAGMQQPMPRNQLPISYEPVASLPVAPGTTSQTISAHNMNLPQVLPSSMNNVRMQQPVPAAHAPSQVPGMAIPSSGIPTVGPRFASGHPLHAQPHQTPTGLQLPLSPGAQVRPTYTHEAPPRVQPHSLPYAAQRPNASVIGRPHPPDTPGLPKGWEKCIDSKTGRIYYKDHMTQSTHWELPPDFCASLQRRVEPKAMERTPTVKPVANGLSQKAKLKRSLSSPNLADLEQEDKASISTTPTINREAKPKQLVDRSTKPMTASRLQALSPVYGSKGRLLTGLKNLGNTCYMNSVIQCLANTSPLARYLTEGHFLEDLNPNSVNRRPGDITKELAFIFKVLSSGQYRSVSPVDLKSSVGRFAPQFAGATQQDAHEFLMFFLDGLHEDVNKIQKRIQMKEQNNDNLPDEVAAEKAWVEYKRKNDSIVVDLFQGQFRSTVTCLACHKKSVTFDAFNCLPLQLTSKNSCTLQDCIRSFTKPEKIGGNNSWKCSQCKTYREATKTIEIWKLPPILIIQLKRFSSDGIWHNKLQTQVNFPTREFDMRKHITGTSSYAQFKLYAVVNHYGSFECGHYTAYCENAHFGSWFTYDDNAVKQIDRSNAKTSAAYLLFYTAVDLAAYLPK